MARRLERVFNHTFPLLNWKHPVKVSDLEGLWSEDYDPFKRENVFADGPKTRSIFAEAFATENPPTEWKRMKDFYRRTKIKKAVSVTLRIVSLRRTLRSRLILPDGSISFPAADILPMIISTEELQFDAGRRAVILKHGREAATNSFSFGGDTLANFTSSQQGLTPSEREDSINISAYREGILVAFDSRNLKILYSNVENVFAPSASSPSASMAESTSTIALKLPSQYSSATSDSAAPIIDWPSRTWTVTHSTLSIFFTNMDNIFSKEINKNLGGLGRYSGLTMTEKQQQRLLGRASKDDAPTAGVDHLQRLLSFDNDAGLDYFFFQEPVLIQRSLPPPDDQVG
ncbi:hypothetical protein TrVGV298_001665 [Trichoderma virens]|nr:hypothetical protein TrVGV298_001665 [Trichoderma virens]